MPASRRAVAALAWLFALFAFGAIPQEAPLVLAKRAFQQGEYTKAIGILRTAAAKDPQNGEIQILLAQSYLESGQYDAAISSAEKAVSINPKSSGYHDWLGRAYGGKADHASVFSAYPLARKTQKEFEIAVQLDGRNYEAMQHLIEYDCAAPSIVGGGEDKAQPLIQKLLSLDAAEGHYAAGNCRQQKKDFAAADAEFAKALESNPQSVELIYGIGDYAAMRRQADVLLKVVALGKAVAPNDPRGEYFSAVAWVLLGQKLPEAEKRLQNYLQVVPPRSSYPEAWRAHFWLGQLYEREGNMAAAHNEYQSALKLNGKFKDAQEALKRSGSR